MSFVSTAVQRVLEDGQFCAVAAPTPNGPHCTPLVFAYSGARIWLTTSRRSVKARAWRVDPLTAGLIRDGDLSVAFTGTVKT
nr:pyridoxamine 5'-phosphate oxidase family protein [Actinomycetota bacterium]